MRLKMGVVAALAAAVAAAGCGGSASHTTTAAATGGGASVAPASAVAYFSVDSNLDSAAWTKAKALLDRFPGKDELIANLRSSLRQEGLDWETDLKPALGDEVDAVWLDFQNNGDNVVGLTKPKDAAKFEAALAKAKDPPVHEVVDGWTVFAHSQALLDRFDQARSSGSLQDDSTFSDSFGGLPADSIAKGWVRGDAAQTAFDGQLQSSGLPAHTTKNQVGTLDAFTAAVTPASDGIKLAATFSGDLDAGVSSYHAELPGAVPAGAIFYLSVNNIGDSLRKLLDSVPNFDQQRAQIELALGYPLDDVFALLSGEAGLAVYPNEGGTPGVLFVAKVNNEAKAQNILNRLVALAALSGRFHAQTVQIGAVQAKEIAFPGGISAYAAVFDGNLVTTNSRKLIEDMQGTGPKLADDSAYQAALAGARVPQETNGFVYADVKETLEYLTSYVEGQGGTVPQAVKDNWGPLRGLLLYASKDGGGYTLTGFLGIQ